MATSSLAARCPACQTVFRVVPDQLRVSEGWVRCGRCAEVFNATLTLVDIDTGTPRRAADVVSGPAPGAGLAPPSRPDADEAPAAAAPAPMPAPAAQEPAPLPDWAVHDEATIVHALHGVAPGEDPEGRQIVGNVRHDDIDPRAEPDDKPSFVRQAERAQRWRQPRVRAALAVVALLGLLTLLAQATHEYRDLVAARFPDTRPVLEAACGVLGCKVEPAHAINSLTVESSGLVRVEKSSIYKLQVALRNRAGIDVALPALDLTLTDSQGRLIARKVLRTAELGVSQATLAAGRELALQATLQAATAAPNQPPMEPVSGYTIELFYP
jgi:predicted Zn finger-like uncharacterized protein